MFTLMSRVSHFGGDDCCNFMKTPLQHVRVKGVTYFIEGYFQITNSLVLLAKFILLYNALNPMNNLEGPQVDPNYLIEVTPFDTRGDFENFIARLEAYPSQSMFDVSIYDVIRAIGSPRMSRTLNKFVEWRDIRGEPILWQLKGRMEEAIKQGHTNHNVSVNQVTDQIDKLTANIGSPRNSPFYKPFNETLDNATSISQSVKIDLRSRGETAVKNFLMAFQNLSTWMTQNYYQSLRPNYGVNSWDKGENFYQACLKWHLSLDLTPEEVHDKGLKEVERIYNEMKKTEVLNLFNEIIHQRIEPKLPQLFKDLPNLPVQVVEMANDGPGGMYSPGLPDGSRPGVFLLNLFRPEKIYAITADIPKYRSDVMFSGTYNVPYSFPEYTAYIEGWALYAESLGEEMKIYQDDYELMGRYGSEIFRACRLVVDTVDSIRIEIDRYITWPGQACAYKIGELKIKELRRKAEQELGNRFNIKDFHSVVLKDGSMSLTMLERFVNNWIETVKRTPVNPHNDCINGVSSNVLHSSALLLVVVLFFSAI
ncbi:hypothetical protein KUTeg_021605 [Tegillarca granosa]|uniref:Uncharacterized protein n=1 Tax=Tegillarca granosa TaxID=220873 RepID=A0ABQ9E8G9_TEGGR|nr:hypothetical protein KUTeg_021605 [Tegillarca granosa]